MVLQRGSRIGSYEIVGPLGAGGMGEVYRAHDPKLRREVALKVLPAEFAQDADRRQRFEREARAASGLNHPNIITIHDIGTCDSVTYIVMELVDGPRLRDMLAAGPLPMKKLLGMAVQAAEGLAKAHAAGIVHRDLKPENIMVSKDGVVKILDFGLAKLTTGTASHQSKTPTATLPGVVLGTEGYMSPEQASGRPVDFRSDQFAFGSILYEMASGKRAFQRSTTPETLAAILRDDPAALAQLNPSVPAPFRWIVERCLAKDPEERAASTLDLAAELRTLRDHLSETSASNVDRGLPGRRRRRVTQRALTAALVAAAVATSFWIGRRRAPQAGPSAAVRFFISPPAETALAGSIAVAPDGKQLAFVAADAEGKRSLFVRPLDSLTAHALPGTEAALHPFWSPDGRFIAFFADGKLKKARVEGGPPQPLCEVFDARGGTWNRDGVILFSPNSGDPLYRISDNGGPVTRVTALDRSAKETSHQWPRFLPDGRHFLYLVSSAQPETRGIHVGSLDGKEARRLMEADWGAAFAPGSGEHGYVLFLRGRTLMAQPFDAAGLRLAGEPVPVANQLWYDETVPGLTSFSVSESGVLAYRTGGVRSTRLEWFDRIGRALGSPAAAGAWKDPRLSPDGSRVAVPRIDAQTATLDIWLIELARPAVSRFTFHSANDGTPVWSPDGSRIVFASDRDGTPDLYQKAASGVGSEERLLASPTSKYPTGWSADGAHLIYATWDSATQWDLWVLPMSGEPKPVPYLRTEFDAFQAQFSPDSKWIAYASNESNPAYEVYVQPFPMAAGKWQVSSGGGSQPSWRRDGRELFYLAPDRRLMAVEVKTGPTFEPGTPRPLFQTQVTGLVDARNHYLASADGQRFLVSTIVGESTALPVAIVLNWLAGQR